MSKRKYLNPLSLARFQSILFGLLGLLAGVIYSFGGFTFDLLVTFGTLSPEAMGTPGLSIGTLLAFGALIGMPLLGILCGWILGFIEAIIYNAYAKTFGGIHIDV